MQNAELLRFQFCILHSTFCILGLVRKGGLEPPRPLGHWILSPARLPIPPLSRDTKKGPFAGPQKVGAPTRTRTWNQQIKSLLLYQLSYGGRTRCNEPPRANISREAADSTGACAGGQAAAAKPSSSIRLPRRR